MDKDKYEVSSKGSKGYLKIIKDNYGEPWEVYMLRRSKKHSKLAWIVSDFIVGAGPMETLDQLDDMSPYFLVKKDGLKLLVNIRDYILKVVELPENINDKRFVYEKNIFKQFKKV